MIEALAAAGEKIAEISGELIEKAAELSAEIGEKINEMDLDSPISLENLTDSLDCNLGVENNLDTLDKVLSDELNGVRELTTEEKKLIKDETGWSDKIVNSIGSMKEYEIYKNADLIESEINGKPCLIKSDIDMSRKDTMGRNNNERMSQGLAPLDNNGEPVELHHIGQKNDSPLAELTREEHRGVQNDSILHDKTIESQIDRNRFNTERANHWKGRAEEV